MNDMKQTEFYERVLAYLRWILVILALSKSPDLVKDVVKIVDNCIRSPVGGDIVYNYITPIKNVYKYLDYGYI